VAVNDIIKFRGEFDNWCNNSLHSDICYKHFIKKCKHDYRELNIYVVAGNNKGSKNNISIAESCIPFPRREPLCHGREERDSWATVT